jgi:hypothetical protein
VLQCARQFIAPAQLTLCSGLASQCIHVCVHPDSFTRVMAAMRRLGRHPTHMPQGTKLMVYCDNLTHAHIQARLLVCDTPMPLG